MREIYVGQQVQIIGSARFADEGPWTIVAIEPGGRIRCSKRDPNDSGERTYRHFNSQEFATLEEFNIRRELELNARREEDSRRMHHAKPLEPLYDV